jgi:hypothetical protein
MQSTVKSAKLQGVDWVSTDTFPVHASYSHVTSVRYRVRVAD